MKIKNTLLGLLGLSLLGACSGGGSDNFTTSGFTTPSATGAISEGLTSNISSGVETIGAEGIAWQTGSRTNDGFFGYAGIIPGTAVAAAPTNGGMVTYVGLYELS
ncbi:MAG: hypothetical protein AAGD04_14495 [Pseudomonadota bacterium]